MSLTSFDFVISAIFVSVPVKCLEQQWTTRYWCIGLLVAYRYMTQSMCASSAVHLHFSGSSFRNATAKELQKSVQICHSYQKKAVCFLQIQKKACTFDFWLAGQSFLRLGEVSWYCYRFHGLSINQPILSKYWNINCKQHIR